MERNDNVVIEIPQESELEECCLCITPQYLIQVSPCSHEFCESCLIDWRRECVNGNPPRQATCPLCRWVKFLLYNFVNNIFECNTFTLQVSAPLYQYRCSGTIGTYGPNGFYGPNTFLFFSHVRSLRTKWSRTLNNSIRNSGTNGPFYPNRCSGTNGFCDPNKYLRPVRSHGPNNASRESIRTTVERRKNRIL